MSELSRDRRHAIRLLLRSPGFTCAAVVSLGLGIGGSTAVFTVIDVVPLRPLSFPDSSRLAARVQSDFNAVSPGYFFRTLGIPLLAVALLASSLPAQRAARLDPLVALRYE